MSESLSPAPPQKSRSGLKVVLIVLAVVVLLGLLACGGMIALLYYGVNAGLTAAMKQELDGNPVIVQEIGEIESITMDLSDTAKRADPEGQKQILSCEIVGTKGSGQLIVEVAQGGSNDFNSMVLETSDGRTVPIPLDDTRTDIGEAANTELDSMDIDLGDPVQPDAPLPPDAPTSPDSGDDL
jgi:hypothetical protein